MERNGHNYRIDRLNAFQKLHVSRRVSPLIVPMVPVFESLDADALSKREVLDNLEPLAAQLASLPDADVEYIVNTSLSAVKRESGGQYYPVMNNGRLMYDDIDMPDMLYLTYDVIVDQLGPFINGFLPGVMQASE